MGARAKKALKNKLKKGSSQLAICRRAKESSDFLAVRGGEFRSKTGKSKHYGFLEFENPEVAKVVADEIHGYLLFEHNLQIQLIPPERVHPKLWKRVHQERTVEEHQRMVQGILKRDAKRRKQIEAAGIDYECPEFVGNIQPAAKKINFDEEED